jgi:hypothetical protein
VILDARTASLATGVPVRTIQHWARVGRITDHSDATRLHVNVDEVAQLRDTRNALPQRKLPAWESIA